MAKQYELTFPAHPNIYQFQEREIQVCFSEPENGITYKTGILLMPTGFGESMMDEYNRHARNYLSDQFDLVTVQCAHFGSEFMGGSMHPTFVFKNDIMKSMLTTDEWDQVHFEGIIDMNKLMEIGPKYSMNLEGNEKQSESIEKFSDMGLMQAIDNLTALLAVIAVIKDNDYEFNASRIIAYGQGHGAYLSLLCNAFAPRLFSLIIDHNSWLLPPYLKHPRLLYFRKGKMSYSIRINYFAANLPYDEEILSLRSLYKKFPNNANIISFQQTNDEKINQKKSFCQLMKFCMYNELSNEDELNNDYIKLFEYVMNNVKVNTEERESIQLFNIEFDTKNWNYSIDYKNGMPFLNRIEKKND